MHPTKRTLGVASVLALGVVGLRCQTDQTAPPLPVQPTPPLAQTPEPAAEVYGCGLPRGTGLGYDCHKETPQHLAAINTAIDRTEQERPDLFRDLLRNGGAYMDEVVENLRKAGYCALNDKNQEIAVKNSNDFSEQYDILSAGGHVLRAYMVTCRPAWDAIPPHDDRS